MDVCGLASCGQGAKYKVTTNTSANRANQKTGYWSFQTITSNNQPPTTAKDRIVTGERLNEGDQIVSKNQKYRAIVQSDGNFVIYGPKGGLWATQTHGKGKGCVLVVQGDGNVVLYQKGIALWASNTHGKSKGGTLVMQNDGNLVLYDKGKALWASNTVQKEEIKTRSLNTIYAADGTPVIQFKYKKAGQTYATECSAPKWLKDPTSKKYREIFSPACHGHDLDYQAPWRMAGFAGYSGKKISDHKFLQEMNKICKQRYNNIAEETYCKTVAVTWFEAVNHFGKEAFDNGQETAKRDIDAASIKKGGNIKFYNGAAYVARYTLTYQINGQTKRFETGNISAGRSKSYGLPAGATNIYVKGEGKTGLVWEPWRTTFSKSYPTAISQCFKSKGTTLGQKWDTSCE